MAVLGLARTTGNKKLNAVLRKLENYDFEPITRSCSARYGWAPKKARKVELEAKRFFSFAFLDPGHYHIPEEDVDEYWHRMILHTQWYQKFCMKMFGDYYHHTPEPDKDLVSKENRMRSLRLIEHWYGYPWQDLVKTCTQCRGPYKPRTKVARELAPSKEARMKD
ncbi:glycine-rich domain-containing protein [Variovorax ginsengisoli]|uniref:Uncharacterized protein n=1 Tax=Variovorax ginsengisoli TaxID=363844 RepID=A0ABT8SC04_9BURK|nr:hypothetical protein [Variovorax ginsengisoli]MDN8617193.1 hypothetical protein [Variovorax ginsengisoli]MDO1536363.1 hypothetical protein [Variovorax ginsengisoli]